MRYLLTLLTVFVCTFATSAQLHLGLRASYGFSDIIKGDDLESIADQFTNASSLSFGAILEYRISSALSLRSGAEINRRGTTVAGAQRTEIFGVVVPISSEAKTRFTYLDIPLMAQLTLPTEALLQPYLFFGPTFGFATQGNVRTTSTGTTSGNLMTSVIDLNEIAYDGFHVAAKAGLGARLNLGDGFAAFVEGRFEQSLTEPYNVASVGVMTGYRGVQFGAGFMFAL
ncbi:MAG: porin family protein [Bacteroidota bacterium]